MTRKIFSSLFVILMVLQCFLMGIPTASAESVDLSSAGIVVADESSVVNYSDDTYGVQTERGKSEIASVGKNDIADIKATPLKITRQPISATAKNGEAVKVTFSATGEGLTYKWYYKNAGATKFTRTTTFTSNTYSTTMNSTRNGRQIYCVVTDKFGNSVKTNTVSLSMKVSLSITQQPVSVQAQLGTTAKVTVSAKGEGLTYKWYYKNAGSEAFKLTNTFTSNTYAVSMTDARNGRQVYCVITDKYGTSVKSNVVSLSKGTVLEITKQPQSVVTANGDVAKVTFTAKGEGLVYEWYYKNEGHKKFYRTDKFKTNTYAVTMNGDRDGRQLYCVVTDKYGNAVKTETVTITMGTVLEITKQPVSVTLPAGKMVNITFDVKGDGLTYEWYYKNAGSSKFVYTSKFKSNTYSVEMNKARDGRMLYCEITDKYGNTVRTNTVVLDMGTSLKITKQPTSLTVHKDHKAKVSFTVTGDGLSYKWYYKNSNGTEFAITNTYKSNYYSVIMNAHRSGRQVYCVVTDKYGDSVTTDTVTITMDHIYGDWEVYRAATAEREGVERRSCSKCSYYKDRTIPKLEAVYYITTDLGTGTLTKIGVPASGAYNLANPKRVGYSFAGWKDADGNDFPREGIIKEDITITALWNLDGTDTLRELIDRTNAGVEAIKITSDIVISKTIYISYNTKIYSDGDFSLIRDPNFMGDMFVVGSDYKGESSVNLRRDAVLTLGGGEGTLTLDGNRDNVTGTVVGSMIFAADSSTLNLYDGIVIANNKKLGNDRIYSYGKVIGASTAENAGGAGILNLYATVNMYGGVVENNLVATQHTPVINEDGTESLKESFGCGGGIYNRGHFNMYGGKITGNEALRGGGFYTDRVAYMISGEISHNISHYYGAAISTSSTQHADLYIGSKGEGEKMLIHDNHAYRAGGALYSNTSSPIIIYGNTVFSNNKTDSSGGAIYTAGPLTISDTVFDSNSCVYSGGAIYHHYTKAEFNRRLMELTNCTFKNNKANLGGAIILSAQSTVEATGLGTYATIKDCNFTSNRAVVNENGGGNGGALYITRKSETVISRCHFEENTADTNAGAVAAHSESHVDMINCDFLRNRGNFGGAMYTSSGSKVELENILFDSNKTVLKETGSGGNGGALYVSLATPTFKNVDFINNSAANHAGAVYMHATTLEFDNTCSFDSNSAAAHGGAFYLTYRNLEDGTKDGSVLKATDVHFNNNSALTGGAISVRTGCDAQLKNVTLTGNFASGTGKDAQGGGSVYVGFGSVSFDNVIATNNSSLGYGGVINAVSSVVDIKNSTYKENVAMSGGVFNGISNSTLNVIDSQFIYNESNYINTDYNNTIGGGAINLYSGVLNISNSTLDGNKSGYYGGAVIAAKAQVNINNNTVVKNSEGSTGSALFFRYGCTTTLENISIIDNTSYSNGVLYTNGGTLDVINVNASGNKAVSGGVLYASGSTTQVTLKDLSWSGNTGTNGGVGYVSDATVTADNCQFTDNIANLGGVFYGKKATFNIENVEFSRNTAVKNPAGGAGNGGVITMTGGTANLDSLTRLTNNSAENHAGGVYVSYVKETLEDGSSVSTPSTLTATGTLFDNNTAMAGAAVSIRTGCSAELNDLTLSNNSVDGYSDTAYDGDGEGGGAIYVGYGSLTLNNITANGNTSTEYGGVVEALGAKDVVINGGKYFGNSANTGAVIRSIGKSNVLITDAVIEENAADSYGVIYHNTGNVSMKNVKASGNTAGYGGVLYASNASVNVNIIDSVFENNTSYLGGALSINSGSATIENSTFKENSSIKTATGSSGNGGALLVNAGTVTLTGNNIFDSNSAENHGGAVYVTYSTVNEEKVGGTVTMSDGEFLNNTAYCGGAISSRTNGNVTLTGTKLTSNSSTSTTSGEGGGAVYTNTNILTLSNVTMDGNSSAYYGGTILASDAQVTINEASVVKNSLGTTGAAFAFISTSEVNISDSEIIDNVSSLNGVIYVNNGTLDINKVTAKGNTAVKGGVIYSSNAKSQTSVTDSTFTQNYADNGGIVYIANGTIGFADGNISENTAKVAGVVYSENGKVSFNGTSVTKNSASSSAGVVYATDGTLNFTDASVQNNSSLGHGGVMYVKYTDVTLDSSDFLYNTSNNNAGVLYLAGAKGTITNGCTFIGNSAINHGGAIYDVYLNAVDTEEEKRDKAVSDLTVNGGIFEDNTAMSGAVVSVRSGCDAVFTDSSFINNSVSGFAGENDGDGEGGGAIYVGYGSLTLNNVTATGNTASDFGGVVQATGANSVNINGGIYSENITKSGAVFRAISKSKLTIKDAVIKNNTAEEYGVIYQNTGNISMTNVTASENSAMFGGVLYASNAAVKVNVADSKFENNTANLGGAFNIHSGSAEITNSVFKENKAVKNESGSYGNGGAVIITGGTINATGENSFDGNCADNHGGAVYVTYSTVNDERIGGTVNMADGEFVNNTANCGGAISSRTNGNVTLNGTELIGNTAVSSLDKEGGGAIYTNTNTLTLSDVLMDGNTSGYYAGALMASDAEITINEGSVIKNSQGTTGAALHFASKSDVTITDTEISDNTATLNGVIYINNSTLNITNATATGNTSINGGLIYASNANTKITVSDSTLTQNHGNNGGVIYISNGTVDFVNGTISENTAKTGGVAYSDNANVSFDGTSIIKNSATSSSGVVCAVDGTLNFNNANVQENSSDGNGGVVYAKYTPVTITSSVFTNNSSNNNGGVLYLAGSESEITSSDFIDNIAKNHGAAIYNVYQNAVNTEEEQRDKAVSDLTVTGGKFEGNTSMAGAVVSIRTGCNAEFNGTMFINNSVEGYDVKADNSGVNDGDGEGGGAIYVGYGSVTLNDVIATGNTASDFGGVIESVKSTVNINGGEFSENKSNSGAVVYSMSDSTVKIHGAIIKNNESVYENTDYNNTIGGTVYANGGKLNISATTLDGNKTGYYGGAIFGRDEAVVTITDNSVISNSIGATGSAMYFREACNVTIADSKITDNVSSGNGVVYQIGGTIAMTNVTAEGNEATAGGVLFVSGSSTKAIVSDSTFKYNTAVLGGALNINSAIATLTDSDFVGNKAVKNSSGSNGNGGAIIVTSGTLDATGNNVFDGNSAENHGGAVYVSYTTVNNEKVGGTVTMTDGLFKNNTANAGGAISSRTSCSVTLTGTELTANSATSKTSGEGGGAIYTNDNTMTLTGVVLDGNSTGYYGGALTAINAKVDIEENSQIKNNKGTTGAALEFRGSGTYNLYNVSVTDNVGTKGSGVIYITGNGTLNASNLTASGNTNNNGGVIYASSSSKVYVQSSTFTNNTADNLGGAVDHRSSGALTIKNSTFNGNTAKRGGAFNLLGSGAVTIENSTIDGNTATELGGGIYHQGTGLLTVTDKTIIKTNAAPSGAGLCLDLGAKAVVSSSMFNGNTAISGDGGGILVADTSEEGKSATSLTMMNSVLKNNIAAKKGGAISTDTFSPNLLINVSDSEFKNNSAIGAGGGAVEIQNANQTNATDPTTAKLVFTNCVFTENSAKTTGGAIEIRTSSCAKIDGISATKNTANDNGGVVYLTSNFSRLYLTGSVTLSGNTAKNGTFAYLYNNKYSNPPKIYTTDSSSAAWYKEVKGNTSSVAFDLTTMP